MKRLTFSAPLATACGLILITNVALLAAAGWNRRDEPKAELSLTERELALPAARQDDGTGLELSLMMTHQPPDDIRRAALWKHHELPSVDHEWLDRSKLLELGFRIDLDPAHPDAVDHYSHSIARRVYVVLDYEGEAWNRWIAGREEHVEQLRLEVAEGKAPTETLTDAEAVLAADRSMRSRLFPVDAGLVADELHRRYGDRRRHAVIPGLIRMKVIRSEDGVPTLGGDILNPVVGRIHVSRGLRRPLEAFLPQETWEELRARARKEAENGWPSPTPPRYRADMAVGLRNEPWLVDISRVEVVPGLVTE